MSCRCGRRWGRALPGCARPALRRSVPRPRHPPPVQGPCAAEEGRRSGNGTSATAGERGNASSRIRAVVDEDRQASCRKRLRELQAEVDNLTSPTASTPTYRLGSRATSGPSTSWAPSPRPSTSASTSPGRWCAPHIARPHCAGVDAGCLQVRGYNRLRPHREACGRAPGRERGNGTGLQRPIVDLEAQRRCSIQNSHCEASCVR